MNDKIILPIYHEYAELILSGKKRLEIRKTVPRNICYPCTVYLYETKAHGGEGAVVGFFNCKGIIRTNAFKQQFSDTEVIKAYRQDISERACLTEQQLSDYAGNGMIHGLVVNTPIRFPRPRSLSDFGLSRAPQSWQYVK